MALKLKEAADDGKIVQLVTHSAHQIWLAGLGAFAKAQSEGTKLFDSLVKEGEALQSRASKAANEQLSQLSKNAGGTFDKLEQVFEQRVSRSLNKLGVPTYADIQALSKHVNQLNESVQELLKAEKPAKRVVKGEKSAREASRHA